MPAQVFRERAIKAYQDPDTRGPLLQIVPSSVSRLLLTLGALTAIALVASAFVRVNVVASGRGVVRPAAGVTILRAPAAGVVHRVAAHVGQEVPAGAVLLQLDGEDETPVVAPAAGVVDALPVHEGDYVPAGTALGKIVPTRGPGSKLIGYLAIPSRFRANLAVGQQVRLSYDEYPWAEMGFGEGRIQRISEDLLGPELGEAFAIEHDPHSPPSFLVEVTLDQLPPGAKGAGARGAHNGMSFEGVVPIRTQRVLTLLIKPLARVIGD